MVRARALNKSTTYILTDYATSANKERSSHSEKDKEKWKEDDIAIELEGEKRLFSVED
jgi:hypothetical protein